jgi:hypothetical protein
MAKEVFEASNAPSFEDLPQNQKEKHTEVPGGGFVQKEAVENISKWAIEAIRRNENRSALGKLLRFGRKTDALEVGHELANAMEAERAADVETENGLPPAVKEILRNAMFKGALVYKRHPGDEHGTFHDVKVHGIGEALALAKAVMDNDDQDQYPGDIVVLETFSGGIQAKVTMNKKFVADYPRVEISGSGVNPEAPGLTRRPWPHSGRIEFLHYDQGTLSSLMPNEEYKPELAERAKTSDLKQPVEIVRDFHNRFKEFASRKNLTQEDRARIRRVAEDIAEESVQIADTLPKDPALESLLEQILGVELLAVSRFMKLNERIEQLSAIKNFTVAEKQELQTRLIERAQKFELVSALASRIEWNDDFEGQSH